MKLTVFVHVLIVGLLICSAARLPTQALHNGEITFDCTIRCGWSNACMFNGGSCPEPNDCDCRHFGRK